MQSKMAKNDPAIASSAKSIVSENTNASMAPTKTPPYRQKGEYECDSSSESALGADEDATQ